MFRKIKNRPSATNTETVDITGDDTLSAIIFYHLRTNRTIENVCLEGI